jgi:hypothetical protein
MDVKTKKRRKVGSVALIHEDPCTRNQIMFNIVTIASIKQMLAEIGLLYRSTDINYRIFLNSRKLGRWDGVM